MKKMKKPSWLDEFKEFAVKGNAMALAVGTIIGGAFSTITKSLTNDLIMPVVNIFLGGADFSDAKIKLPRMPWVEPTFETVVNAEGEEVVQEVFNYLTYGNFISAVINFLILALVEQNQRADGSVMVPECLRKYLGGLEIIEKK